jgi:hypothetical protein
VPRPSLLGINRDTSVSSLVPAWYPGTHKYQAIVKMVTLTF